MGNIDYEIEIINRYGGTDYYLQVACTPQCAIERFMEYFDEPCTIVRVWNPTKEKREDAAQLHICKR